MKKTILKFQIIGAVVAILLGSLLHFVFAWSGDNHIIALFAAVNESTWEHLKLAFWAIFFFGIFEYIYFGKKAKNFFLARCKELYLAPILIVAIFYGYTAILGYNILFLDITTFAVAIILAKIVGYWILAEKVKVKMNPAFPIIFIAILALLFMIFTYYPPHIQLFKDKPTGGYGILTKKTMEEKKEMPACLADVKLCPDGSFVARNPANCRFNPCPGPTKNDAIAEPQPQPVTPKQGGGDMVACTQDAKRCPDGSYVGRTGPKCEFTPCP